MSWSASQYTIFEQERTRPVRDLIAAIPTAPVRLAVDIGCGPGNSTELLAVRYPRALVRGLDSSADMLAAARKRLPQIDFQLQDIGAWQSDEPPDVILANAVLHWIPDHATALPALAAQLAVGGSLAVQMPDNLAEPAHCLMREVGNQGPWSATLAEAVAPRAALESAAWYFKLMSKHCRRVDVWRTVYHHPLAGGAEAVVEWFKGSGLRPFLEPLGESERIEYLRRYTAAIRVAYPAAADGSVLLPFPRLFFVATR